MEIRAYWRRVRRKSVGRHACIRSLHRSATTEGVRADGEPLTIADQMFDPKLNQWIVLASALDHNDLNNLKAMYEALEHENDNLKQLNAKLMLNDVAIKQENTALKEKADSLAQINSKTMLASLQNSKDIEEIKEQLNPEIEGGE